MFRSWFQSTLPVVACERLLREKRRSPRGERGLKPCIRAAHRISQKSLPTRGAWIETAQCGRDPGRGASLPTRGAWIETPVGSDFWDIRWAARIQGFNPRSPRGERRATAWVAAALRCFNPRSPRGERGLKPSPPRSNSRRRSRSPRGERGLKLHSQLSCSQPWLSLPTRGAWIETSPCRSGFRRCCGRSPRGERGLKQRIAVVAVRADDVAPHAGSVD